MSDAPLHPFSSFLQGWQMAGDNGQQAILDHANALLAESKKELANQGIHIRELQAALAKRAQGSDSPSAPPPADTPAPGANPQNAPTAAGAAPTKPSRPASGNGNAAKTENALPTGPGASPRSVAQAEGAVQGMQALLGPNSGDAANAGNAVQMGPPAPAAPAAPSLRDFLIPLPDASPASAAAEGSGQQNPRDGALPSAPPLQRQDPGQQAPQQAVYLRSRSITAEMLRPGNQKLQEARARLNNVAADATNAVLSPPAENMRSMTDYRNWENGHRTAMGAWEQALNQNNTAFDQALKQAEQAMQAGDRKAMYAYSVGTGPLATALNHLDQLRAAFTQQRQSLENERTWLSRAQQWMEPDSAMSPQAWDATAYAPARLAQIDRDLQTIDAHDQDANQRMYRLQRIQNAVATQYKQSLQVLDPQTGRIDQRATRQLQAADQTSGKPSPSMTPARSRGRRSNPSFDRAAIPGKSTAELVQRLGEIGK